jgi:hypothetical protein
MAGLQRGVTVVGNGGGGERNDGCVCDGGCDCGGNGWEGNLKDT